MEGSAHHQEVPDAPADLAAAALTTAPVVACPTSGHHRFGAWWFGEMACVGALVVLSVVALRGDTAARSS